MANVGSLIVLDDSQASANANAAAIRGIFTERGKSNEMRCLFYIPQLLTNDLLTAADYLKKIVLEGRSSPETGVIDIMTPQEMIKTIEPSTSVMEAMDIMVEKQIRHLPVIEDGKLVGMVSIRDVVRAMTRDLCFAFPQALNVIMFADIGLGDGAQAFHGDDVQLHQRVLLNAAPAGALLP